MKLLRNATALVAVCLAALGAPAVGSADTVTQWNLNGTNAAFAAGTDGRVVVFHLAMVHGAIYDAVNAIDGGHEGYLISSRVARPADSKDAAAATAAHHVLVNLLPSQKSVLDTQYAASLAGIPDSKSKTSGILVGEAAAAAMIAARSDDGRFGPFRFLVSNSPGGWRPVLPAFVNDPNAWLKDVKPFLIERASQFRSPGPYPIASRRYAIDFNEVKSIGSQSTTSPRSQDQTDAARYWAENPTATWGRILRLVATQRGLSIADSARLFGMTYLAWADSFIAVWDEKAHWSFWRPITAIREAGSDGNPETAADTSWLPIIPNPPYPDHPSGLSAVSGAVAQSLRNFFGTDQVGWSDTSMGGLTRSFTRISQAPAEVVEARIWSGIHFRKADVDGALIGRQIGHYAQRHYFAEVK